MDFNKLHFLFLCFTFICKEVSSNLDVKWFSERSSPKIVNWAKPLVKLGKMNLAQDAVTVSGFGMGGCFAQQMVLAHSNLFSGFALFRPHGVYTCGSGGDVNSFLQKCVQQKSYNYTELVTTAEMYSGRGLIEPLGKLSEIPFFYHFGTANDEFSVLPYIDIFRFWSRYILNPDLIYVKMIDSDFLVPTDDFGSACDKATKDTFYIGNCSYNVPFVALKYLLSKKVEVRQAPKNLPLQPVKEFSQSEFFDGLTTEQTGMATNGLIYIPFNCQSSRTQCYLHVHFHDVLTSAENNGINHYKESGLFRIAERNNIVIIFPQAKRTAKVALDSWDCFGSTGTLYATKNGTQIRVMKKILDRLSMGA